MNGVIVVPGSLEQVHLSAVDLFCSKDIRDSGMKERLISFPSRPAGIQIPSAILLANHAKHCLMVYQ